MTTVLDQHFDQADGVAITPANSAGSGSAFTSVYVTNCPLTYSTTHFMHGSASMKVSPPTGSTTANGTVRYTVSGTPTSYSWRAYFYFTALPSATMVVAYGDHTDSNGSSVNLLNLHSDGSFGYGVAKSDGSGIGSSRLTDVLASLNTWYRAEGTMVTGSAGSYTLSIFAGDATTPLETVTYTGYTGTVGLAAVLVGKNTTAPTSAPFWIDDVGLRTDTTAMGPFAPALPTVGANLSTNGSTGSLSASYTTSNGAAPTYAWTQTAGPTVSLSSASAAAPTFTFGAASTYSFRVTITDYLGRTASDTVSYAYTGAAGAPPVSGSALPGSRWVEVVTAIPANGGTLSYAIAPSTGVSQPMPGVFTAPISTSTVSYIVTVTESGNATPATFAFTVIGTPTAGGSTGVRILVASNDQAAGGSFA